MIKKSLKTKNKWVDYTAQHILIFILSFLFLPITFLLFYLLCYVLVAISESLYIISIISGVLLAIMIFISWFLHIKFLRLLDKFTIRPKWIVYLDMTLAVIVSIVFIALILSKYQL